LLDKLKLSVVCATASLFQAPAAQSGIV